MIKTVKFIYINLFKNIQSQSRENTTVTFILSDF